MPVSEYVTLLLLHGTNNCRQTAANNTKGTIKIPSSLVINLTTRQPLTISPLVRFWIFLLLLRHKVAENVIELILLQNIRILIFESKQAFLFCSAFCTASLPLSDSCQFGLCQKLSQQTLRTSLSTMLNRKNSGIAIR